MGEQSGWQLSDNAPEAYERYIITAFLGEWAQDLVQTAALGAGEASTCSTETHSEEEALHG